MIISRERGLGDDIDAGPVIGHVLAAKDSGLRSQLAPHFPDDSASRLANRVHAEGGENEREQTADEQADDDLRLCQRKLERVGLTACGKMRFQLLDIRTEKNQRRQTGGRDCVTLGDCLHRVTDGVELIRDAANLFR